MVQGREDQSSWMATQTQRLAPDTNNQPLVYEIQNSVSIATSHNFYDQQSGSAYFGELEAALIHGVDSITTDAHKRAYPATTKPPTLEIFPSWPMRQQQLNRGSSRSVGSSGDSGSVKQNRVPLQQEKGATVMASDSSRTREIPKFESVAQEKKKIAGATRKDEELLDAKTLRRLAQNREAAKKSRLRKKAYVQQLETSRMRLQQLEQEIQRSRTQGLFLASCNTSGDTSSGAAIFNMEYSRWLDEEAKHMSEIRGGLHAHLLDGNLGIIVDECIAHYDTLFRLKAALAQSDVIHLLTGLWTTPAERCFFWIGGFRPSDLIKIVMPHLDPLTDQQMVGICGLQHSSQQAEEALSQGLEQLHQSLSDMLASGPLSDGSNADGNNYMGLTAAALDRLSGLVGFVIQADNLRQQTIHQLRRILTTRQAATCFLAIGEYFRRLRTLSSLWSSRLKENIIGNESGSPTPTTELQSAMSIHVPQHIHYSPF